MVKEGASAFVKLYIFLGRTLPNEGVFVINRAIVRNEESEKTACLCKEYRYFTGLFKTYR